MADVLDVVTLDAGGRPRQVVDFNDMVRFTVVADSFTVAPGAKQQAFAVTDRRYGGARQTSESHENGQVGWSILVRGDTADECIASLSAALSVLEAVPGDLYVRWIPDGASHTSLFEIRSTATWTPSYRWAQFYGAKSMLVQLAWQVAPLARGLRMDILDRFDVDTRADYTYDAGDVADDVVNDGALRPAGALDSERRAIHTARGYEHVDSMQQIEVTPGATVDGCKAGLVLKRLDPANRLEVFVDDTGSVSRLRIDLVAAGARTNLATTDLRSRVAAGVPFWVRGHIVGDDVVADVFTAAPGPLSTPAASLSTRLTGGDASRFGAGVPGGHGWVWTPRAADAKLGEYRAVPHFSGPVTLPETVRWATPIPGDAPAQVDVTVTHAGGASPPIWALIAWTRRPAAGLARAPFGLFDAQDAEDLSGWAVTADATARGGQLLKDAAAAAATTYAAAWEFDPSGMLADGFGREVALEVWARVLLSSTLVSPTFLLGLLPADGVAFGAPRWTDEWGSIGKIMAPPASGSAIYRFVRLGTVRALVDPQRPRRWLLWLGASVGTGSSGAFGVDHLLVAPSSARACSPSGVVHDTTYPRFISSTAQTSKTIRSDLSAMTAAPPAWGHPDHGLGGQLLEPPPGDLDMTVKLSSLVPDDPTRDGSTEQLAHTGVVELAVTPRWHLLRSGD